MGNATFSFNSGTTYIFIVRAKAGTSGLLQMTFQTSRFASCFCNFDLNAGTSTSGGTLVGSGMVSEGNGFYACYIIATATSTGTGQAIVARINSTADARLPTYVGNAQTVLIWNPLLFSGTLYVCPPIYTVGSTANVPADNIGVSAAAKTLMDAAKSAYSETRRLTGGTAPRVVDFGGTASLRASTGTTGTTMATVGSGSTATATIGSAGTVFGLVKTAYSFDGSNNTAIANGGTKVTQAGAWGVTTETPQVGNLAALTNALNGYLGFLAFSDASGNFDALTV
jgi:hypothetical protein